MQIPTISEHGLKTLTKVSRDYYTPSLRLLLKRMAEGGTLSDEQVAELRDSCANDISGFAINIIGMELGEWIRGTLLA